MSRPRDASPGLAPTVLVHHPVATVWIPRRARKPRRGYGRAGTPVQPATAPDAAFSPIRRVGDPDLVRDCYAADAHAFGGGVFSPVSNGRRPVTPDEFLSRLAHPIAEDGDRWLVNALGGTPLSARPATALLRMSGQDACDAGGALAPGESLFEDAANAAAAVTRFFEMDIVLTPTRVMRRTPPLAHCWRVGDDFDAVIRAGGDLDLCKPPPVRPDLAAEACRVWAASGDARLPSATAGAISARFPEDSLGDDDIALLANLLPERGLALLDHLLALPILHRSGTWDAVAAHRDALLPSALRGRMGAVAPAAFADVIEGTLGSLGRAGDGLPIPLGSLDPAYAAIDSVSRHVEALVLPRLRAPGSDLEALACLAPEAPRP